MRIAVITDIHHGPVSYSKRGDLALTLLADALRAVRAAGADAILDLGDRISDVDLATDLRLAKEVAEVFAGAGIPRFHVDGNHDRCFLSEADNASALGAASVTRSVDLGPARLVLWQPDVGLTIEHGLRLAGGDLAALEAELGRSDKRTIVASHVPLIYPTMAGNYWFERNRHLAAYAESDAIRAVIAAAPCPVVALAGHVHWNSLTSVDGTFHLTCQSLSESYTTHPNACGAYALLDVADDTLGWRVHGDDAFGATLPFGPSRRRWLPPLPPFSARANLETGTSSRD